MFHLNFVDINFVFVTFNTIGRPHSAVYIQTEIDKDCSIKSLYFLTTITYYFSGSLTACLFHISLPPLLEGLFFHSPPN